MYALRKIVLVLALLCVVFQPISAFAAQLLKTADSTMSCCRTKRSCCCRKDGKRATLPAWKAATECSRTCLQRIGVNPPAADLNIRGLTGHVQFLSAWDEVALLSHSSDSSAYLAFLYQRPPPSLLS
jgi:hypothetical protein